MRRNALTLWRRQAFTLIELLVVISIIALLVGILLPALGTARQAAMDAECRAYLRQGGQVIHMYATDDLNNRVMPGRVYATSEYWFRDFMNRYTQNEGADGFGRDYMRCPSQQDDCWNTYGLNYSGVWFFIAAGSPANPTPNILQAGPPLDDINPHKYLIADSHNRNWGHGNYNGTANILNHQSSWFFNTDWDGDGLNDSNAGEIQYEGPYNGWGPWHFGAGNAVFKDGSVRVFTVEEWVNNQDAVMTPYNDGFDTPGDST